MSAILTQTEFGPMLVPPYDEYLGQAMIREGEYAPLEFETWRPYLFEGAAVVDVGANFGAHTFAFAQAVGPSGLVIAFEPQRPLFHMLAGSCALGDWNNVRPAQLALGAERGIVTVPFFDYRAPNNFGGLELNKSYPVGEDISRVRLDDLSITLDFLKIDVEGMELDVLVGGEETIAKCRPVIAMEADRDGMPEKLIDWCNAHGYRAWLHNPPLGDHWPTICSINLFALPMEKTELPEPEGYVTSLALQKAA